jgi:hypothetical protein
VALRFAAHRFAGPLRTRRPVADDRFIAAPTGAAFATSSGTRMLSTLESAGPFETEETGRDDTPLEPPAWSPTPGTEPPDPMHPLMLPVLVAGAMQPLTQMFSSPSDDEPSDVVSHLLLLLLMESFMVSLGDPFEGELPPRSATLRTGSDDL